MNHKFSIAKEKLFLNLFFIFLILQIFFWIKTENTKPKYDLIPQIPNKILLKIISFGDDEFLFRTLSLRLINSGDVFLGTNPLKNYDYNLLYNWFLFLDELNFKSNLIPSFASYYFAQTQVKSDKKYILNYLINRAEKNLDENWWWLFQAIIIARKDFDDQNLALELSYKLAENNAKNAPLWTKQMPAFIHANIGDGCVSFKIINDIIKNEKKISQQDLDFMKFFINDRLKKIKNFNIKNCT